MRKVSAFSFAKNYQISDYNKTIAANIACQV